MADDSKDWPIVISAITHEPQRRAKSSKVLKKCMSLLYKIVYF
jgi:hypothetical protein